MAAHRLLPAYRTDSLRRHHQRRPRKPLQARRGGLAIHSTGVDTDFRLRSAQANNEATPADREIAVASRGTRFWAAAPRRVSNEIGLSESRRAKGWRGIFVSGLLFYLSTSHQDNDHREHGSNSSGEYSS